MSINGKWEELTPADRIKFQQAMIDHSLWQCCFNYDHWTSPMCYKWKAQPPPPVQILGCESWNAIIPF